MGKFTNLRLGHGFNSNVTVITRGYLGQSNMRRYLLRFVSFCWQFLVQLLGMALIPEPRSRASRSPPRCYGHEWRPFGNPKRIRRAAGSFSPAWWLLAAGSWLRPFDSVVLDTGVADQAGLPGISWDFLGLNVERRDSVRSLFLKGVHLKFKTPSLTETMRHLRFHMIS